MILRCPLCSGPCRSAKDGIGKLYHFCDECGFAYLDRTYHPGPLEEKKRYELHNNDPADEGYRQWLTRFAEKSVFPFAHPGDRILDFGCGPEPVLASILVQKGFEVSWYDKYFYQIPVHGPFDFITSTEVIEHVADPGRFLRELKVFLRPGGFLALMTQFRPAGDSEFFRWWYRQDTTHISFFTEKTLFRLGAETGLSVESSDGKSILLFRN